jgi:hypothetical protein
MKPLLIFTFVLFTISGSVAQISLKKLKDKIIAGPLSAEEVGQGLKEALTNGVSKGSDLLAQADGYFKNQEIKIPFPPEVQMVETKNRQIISYSESTISRSIYGTSIMTRS